MATHSHDIATIREAVRREMGRTGMKAKELSKLAGLNETAVRDLLDRVTDPRLGTLTALAGALGCSPSTLFGGIVQVTGCIRDGGEIVLAPACGCEAEFVHRPPEAVGELMAFNIAGDSFLPAYGDGDVVYCARDDSFNPEDAIGEECVMQLSTGAWVFKRLAHGQRAGMFTLRSFNRPDVENVGIAWLAPALFVMRSRLNRSRKKTA